MLIPASEENYVLAGFSVAVIKHWPKGIWRFKGLISSYTLQFITKRKKGRNLGQKHGGRSWRRGHGGTLLIGLLPMTCSIWFLVTPRTTCPGVDPQWAGLSQISHQWRMTTDMPTGQPDGDNSSTKFLLPWCLSSYHLDKNYPAQVFGKHQPFRYNPGKL